MKMVQKRSFYRNIQRILAYKQVQCRGFRECVCLFTSVDEHESLPQTHAQQGVLHHQARQAPRRVALRTRHVVDKAPIPGGQQRVGAPVPLSADTPRLRAFPVRAEAGLAHGTLPFAQRSGPVLPGLGPQQQLSEVRADGAQHGGVRPAQLLPRLPSVKSHICELHAALQQPLHVLGEAGLFHSDGGETC